MRIQNIFKNLWWSFLQQQLTIVDIWQGFEYATNNSNLFH